MESVVLYGSPMSLYTGRARSYLIKAGIPYRELPPTTPHFLNTVLPKAGGRRSLPTVELADGTVIRDGVAIVDHFEAKRGAPYSPRTPKQRIVSRLFDAIGAEGLLRPAMHYRWNFDAENLAFLRFHFRTIFPAGDGQAAEERMRFIRRVVNPAWGLAPDAVPATESLYLDLLDRLNAHFAEYPYLLGGKPCVGDFGMMAPMYGHLGRDPKPRSLMQTRAVRTFRWVERMNRPEPDIGEFDVREEAYLADDAVPDSLIAVLKQLAIDYVPETRAACACINEWLAEHEDMPAGATAERGVGTCTFDLIGTEVSAIAQPFRFHVLKRVQDEVDALRGAERTDAEALLSACDMAELMDLRLSRGIGRRNNLEVWL